MGIEPRDLGALEKAVNDAAGRASNLWISFVFFATLIAITTGTVTHKHLFLELPLKLPVLNVDLPLMGYFFAVPLFFVVFHFYILLQLDGLGAKIEDYNAVLREQHPHAGDRRLLRQRLDSFIFAQVLVGARDRREGRIGALNRAVAWMTMVGLPIGVLLLLQLIFLPYHHELMTWWHRICILADLALLWFFWGRIGGGDSAGASVPAEQPKESRTGAGSLRAFRAIQVPPAIGRIAEWSLTAMRWTIARSAVTAGAVVVLFATLVAAYPTEWVYGAWFRAPLQPLTRLLFEGDLQWHPIQEEEARSWLGSNRLLLADTDLGVEEKLVALAKTREALDPSPKERASAYARAVPRSVTLSLRNRDLSYANLLRVDLRQVDLSGAKARGAILAATQLQGADLSRAQLQGAVLGVAQLQSADLSWAQLHGADLSWAQLQGATIRRAQLQGADLALAQLHGADLSGAQLQGADLSWAQLQGADLSDMQLHGAKLTFANVYRTSCSLPSTNAPSGRCLRGAGADARHVDMRKILRAQREDTDDGINSAIAADDAAAYRKFVDDVLSEVPTRAKEQAKERLSVLEPGARTREQDAQLADRWLQERLRSLSPSRRAHIIARIACGADGAPHVARGLLRNGRLRDTRHHLHEIAARMREARTDASKCAGVRGFLDVDWEWLDVLVKRAPPKPDAAQPRAGK